MKRKMVLRALALAVLLIGLVLVWRAGQWARAEAEVYAAVARYVANPHDRPDQRMAFVSIKGHDPSALLCQLIQAHRIQVLPGSAYSYPKSAEEQSAPFLSFWGIEWQNPRRVNVWMAEGHAYHAELQGRRWNVSEPHRPGTS